MKKYICSECGFRSRLQVQKIKRENGAIQHRCRNCDAVAYPSKKILENVMRGYMLDKKLNFSMK